MSCSSRCGWLFVAALMALTCSAPAAAQVRARLVASGFDRPVGFIQHPTDRTVQLVLEQGGRVRVLKSGVVQPSDFLDIRTQIASGGEQGLLGLAFAPNFSTSRRVFVSFTNPAGHSVIARFATMANDVLRVDATTRFDLQWPGGQRWISQPFTNHNGGNIAFGPDNYLYAGFGDGGSGNDPFNNAQNLQSLLGKMLRLDVLVPDADVEGYNVPGSNPFVGRADALPEIWALGLRNPWRWSFDDVRLGGTGALVIGDVGQDAWEEVDYQPPATGGRNYGWRNREGAHNNVTTAQPATTPLREPIWEYSHNAGRSITGGYVYRGQSLGASFIGRYFFADFVTSRIWSLAFVLDPATHDATAGGVIDHTADLGAAASSPSSFGIDADGELYVVTYGGAIYQVLGANGQAPATPPASDGARRVGDNDRLGIARPRSR